MNQSESLFPSVEQLLSDQSWALRLARRLANSHADAEDLVQEGWVAVMRTAPSYRQGLRPWLTETLRHLASNQRRSKKRRDGWHAENAVMVASSAVPSPEEMVGRMELQRLIAELSLELPAPIRDVIFLRFYQGLSSVQIARILKEPEGTIRWRLKSGLDTLRLRLDEKHQGRRDEWLRGITLFFPQSTTQASKRSPWAWRVAVLLGAVLVATIFQMKRRPGRAEGEKNGSQTQVLRAEGGAFVPGITGLGPSRPAPILGSDFPVDDLGLCDAQLTATRAQIRELQPEFVATARPNTLFEDGVSNPVATKAVLPALDRVMKGERSMAPDYTFECRNWACRMTVLVPDDQSAIWMKPLQEDIELSERTRGMGFFGGSPVKDPVSGGNFSQKNVYFRLADSSGKRSPRPIKQEGPPFVFPPVVDRHPLTVSACQIELAEAQRRLGTMKSGIDRDKGLDKKFGFESPNRSLTAEIDAVVRTKLDLSPSSSAVNVECRRQICRVKIDRNTIPDLNVFQERVETPDFRRRIEQTRSGQEKYYLIAPADAVVGMDFAKMRLGELLASSLLTACEDQHGPKGRIVIKLGLPRSGEPNEDGAFGKISTRIGGSLADTPFAHCLESVLVTVLTHTALPEKVTSASLTRNLDFPRTSP